MLRVAGIPKLTLRLLLPCCWPPMRFSGAMTADLLVVLVAGGREIPANNPMGLACGIGSSSAAARPQRVPARHTGRGRDDSSAATTSSYERRGEVNG